MTRLAHSGTSSAFACLALVAATACIDGSGPPEADGGGTSATDVVADVDGHVGDASAQDESHSTLLGPRLDSGDGAGQGVGRVSTVGVPLGFGIEEGSVVRLELRHGQNIWGAPDTYLKLHVRDRLVYLLRRNIESGELKVARVEAACEDSDSCGIWKRFSVEASVEGEGQEPVLLGENEQRTRGEYTFWHGRTVGDAEMTTGCLDWVVGDGIYAVSHDEPLYAALAECEARSVTTEWGAVVELDAPKCTFTAAEAAAGIEIPYTITINGELEVTTTADSEDCTRSGVPGLLLSETVEGEAQRYTNGDLSDCKPNPDAAPSTLDSTYERSFRWNGRNGSGADGKPAAGEPFPPGAYTLTIETNVWSSLGGKSTVSLPITITP